MRRFLFLPEFAALLLIEQLGRIGNPVWLVLIVFAAGVLSYWNPAWVAAALIVVFLLTLFVALKNRNDWTVGADAQGAILPIFAIIVALGVGRALHYLPTAA